MRPAGAGPAQRRKPDAAAGRLDGRVPRRRRNQGPWLVRPGHRLDTARVGGPVQVLAAGAGLVGSEVGQDVFLTLPGGAKAQPLLRGTMAALLAQLPSWRAIGGISDGLLPDHERRTGDRPPPSMEECLLAVWPGPFGWLLLAEPLSAAEIGEIADELAQREQYSTGNSDRFPERATAARRLSLRHAEIRKGASAGLWRVRLLAGATSADAASRVAGLVCASADLDGLPYAVTPASSAARRLRDVLAEPTPAAAGGDAVPGHPFYASTELIAALARPPEREMPGIRLALQPDFDVTQEPAAGRAAIAVGTILDRNRRSAGPLVLPLGLLEPARVRQRGHWVGQVADGAGAARGRHRGPDPLAGGRAGQGRIPADGRAAGRDGRRRSWPRGGGRRGCPDPAG